MIVSFVKKDEQMIKKYDKIFLNDVRKNYIDVFFLIIF